MWRADCALFHVILYQGYEHAQIFVSVLGGRGVSWNQSPVDTEGGL